MFSLAAILAFFSGGSALLKTIIDAGVVLVTKVLEFITWYLKEFWTGLGVIFHNLSTLTVILAVFILGGYYFKTWDNDRVLKECIKTCPAPIEPKKYYHPVKRKILEEVAPSKIVTHKVVPKKEERFNPFGGN